MCIYSSQNNNLLYFKILQLVSQIMHLIHPLMLVLQEFYTPSSYKVAERLSHGVSIFKCVVSPSSDGSIYCFIFSPRTSRAVIRNHQGSLSVTHSMTWMSYIKDMVRYEHLVLFSLVWRFHRSCADLPEFLPTYIVAMWIVIWRCPLLRHEAAIIVKFSKESAPFISLMDWFWNKHSSRSYVV